MVSEASPLHPHARLLPLLPPPADARFLELLAGPDGPWSRGGVGQEGRWVFNELLLGRGQQVSLWRLPLLQVAFKGLPEYFPGTGLEEVEATGKGGHSLTSVVGQAWAAARDMCGQQVQFCTLCPRETCLQGIPLPLACLRHSSTLGLPPSPYSEQHRWPLPNLTPATLTLGVLLTPQSHSWALPMD